MTPNNNPKQTVASWAEQLTESALNIFSSLGFGTAQDYSFLVNNNFGAYGTGFGAASPPRYQDNTDKGEDLPIFRDLNRLRLIRNDSRVVCAENEFAICGVENRVNYIVGEGFKISHPDPEAQAAIDYFCELNDLDTIIAEAMRRGDVDGEFFLRAFPDSNGFFHLRFVEPEWVRDPSQDSADPANSFGVITAPNDVQTVEGYWIVEDPYWSPNHPTKVDARWICHGKFNVNLNSKRGCPTYYPVMLNLKRCERLLSAMTSMASARAKIALIREITGVTSANAQALVSNLTANQGGLTVTDPATGQVVNVEQFRDGQILTTNANTKYIFPAASLGAGDFVEVLQAELRGIAGRLQMSEWMFTGVADAKYNNAFIAESPTYKAFSRLQKYLTRLFGGSRYGTQCGLVWRQLRHLVEEGMLSPDVLKQEVKVVPPTLEVKDRSAEAQVASNYVGSGIWSKETAREKSGVDPIQERKRIEIEQKQEQPTPGVGPSPDGLFTEAQVTAILEAFTGIITDKAGRRRKYVDGKPVKLGRDESSKFDAGTVDRDTARKAVRAAMKPDTLTPEQIDALPTAFGEMNRKELNALAKSLQIKGMSRQTKDRLVEAVLKKYLGGN